MTLLTPARILPLVWASQGQRSEGPLFPTPRVPLRSSVVTMALESSGLRSFPRTETSQRPLPHNTLCGAEWGDLTDPSGLPLAPPGVRSQVGGGVSQSAGRQARQPARERGHCYPAKVRMLGPALAILVADASVLRAPCPLGRITHGEPVFQMGKPRLRKGRGCGHGPQSQD